MTGPRTDPYRALLDQLARLDRADAGAHTPGDLATAPSFLPEDPATDLPRMASSDGPVAEPRKPGHSRPAALPGPDPLVARDGPDGASELVDLALRRIAALDPVLNAFYFVDGTGAREAAGDERELPLSGWVIGHKDILLTAGQPTTAGSDLLRHHVPQEDATVVTRLRDAGAVSLGKLAVHEFATGITGTVSAFGPTHNPWDPERIPGGSSCGSAVAVAAGLVRAATATDTGGSIRIPAACCGVVGFKPSYGSVPVRGVIPFSWSLDHVGPIARTVRDARSMLAAMRERSPAGSPRRRALVGVPADVLGGCRPDVAAALEGAAEALENAGHGVRSISLPDGLFDVAPIAAALFLAEGLALHSRCLRRSPDRYQPETSRLLRLGEAVSGVRYVHARRLRRRLAAVVREAMQEIDVILCPVLPMTAPLASADVVDLPGGPVDVRSALTRFTRPFNVTGQPALVVPCGVDEQGLPIAVQLVGRFSEDELVLDVGEQLQEATGLPSWPALAVDGVRPRG